MSTSSATEPRTFDQLEPGEQQQVLDRHRDITVDHKWWDHICYQWSEKLERLGFQNPEIQFSGFYSQGDGASFTSFHVTGFTQCQEIADAWADLKGAAMLVGLDLAGYGPDDLISCSVNRLCTRYVHENTVYPCWEYYGLSDGDSPDELAPYLDRLERVYVDYCENGLKEWIRELCREIYSDLQQEYEYLTSDTGVVALIRANDYVFDENLDTV